MNNQLLLWLLLRTLPFLALIFVVALVFYKIYIKIRSKYNINVNCWFCNENTHVPFPMRNSWNCPHCEQYNGFNSDGDYNRDMIQQRDCSTGLNKSNNNANNNGYLPSVPPMTNGFCEFCNEAQRLKVEKLAQFEPKNESRFDEELKVYSAQLEQQHSLCATCERHLKSVLLEKKKMVLGSKFLDTIIKGAIRMKQPHFDHLTRIQKQFRMRRIMHLITAITLINIILLLSGLPHVRREQFIALLGTQIGQYTFFAYSHVLAFIRVIEIYLGGLNKIGWIIRVQLFLRTISMMAMYTFGLTHLSIMNLSFSAFYSNAYPFAMLALNFAHNVTDGLKFSRFTLMLLYWSVFAAGLLGTDATSGILLISSIFCLMLTLSKGSKIDAYELDKTDNSFHKWCHDDYLDDESISMLSQQLNSSNNSTMSAYQQQQQQQQQQQHHHHNHLLQQQQQQQTFSVMSSANDLRQRFNAAQLAPKRTSPPSLLARSKLSAASEHNYLKSYDNRNYVRSPLGTPHSLFSSSLERCHAAAAAANRQQLQQQIFTEDLFMPHTQQQQQKQHNHNFVTPSMQSVYSLSSNAVYQPQHMAAHGTPMHFSTTNLNQKHHDTSAWLALNGIDVTAPKEISRTSSVSSGFESQFNGPSVPNETPFNGDIMFDTVPENAATNYANSEISDLYGLRFCGGGGSGGAGAESIAATDNRRQSFIPSSANSNQFIYGAFDRDSFNLSKMNEQLPRIKRGDLLRKWDENRLRDVAS